MNGTAPPRVLVVDDEPAIRELVTTVLRYEGFEVATAENGRDALTAVEQQRPHLVVLDVMLPDLDGFAVQQRLTASGQRVPVLFLTARDTVEDKVRGLTLGGDDYLTKPFSLGELVARIHAVLRRTHQEVVSPRLVFEDLELDEDTFEVRRAGKRVELTPTEFKLLRFLMRNPRRVLSKAQILDHVWEYDFGGDGNIVETYISYLRRKVDAGHPALIHTVRGVGYTLRAPRAETTVSLRLRVTLLALVALLLGLVAGGAVVPVLVERFLTDRLDEQLLDVTPAAVRFADPRLPDFGPGERLGPLNATAIYVARQAPDGSTIGGFTDGRTSENVPELPAVLDSLGGRPATVSGTSSGRFRVLVTASRFDPEYTYAVALPFSEVDATVRRVITIEVVTIALALVGVAGLAWWLIGVGLRPLRRMEETAADIAETGEPGQGQRIEHPSEKTELGQLGATLNTMLDRIDESFTAQRATEARLRHFAADASHELRTPLTSIRGYAELYRRGGDDPAQVARSMGRIEEEAGRMGALVEDLLTITRLDEGRPLERRPVDVSELAAKAVADARVVDPDRPILLDAPAPVTIEGDPNRLMQVMVNLLGNAQVHTPAGTPVSVRAWRNGVSAVLEVEDHGPGLTPEQAAQVFDRFYRADPSRSRAHGGSGLGLAIVDAVVRAHGGTPSVHATPGGGATFRVVLPISADGAGAGGAS